MPQRNGQQAASTKKQSQSQQTSSQYKNLLSPSGKGQSNSKAKINKHAPSQSQSQVQTSNEELATLQQQEVEVLESILGPDFSRVDADAQSAWHKSATASPIASAQSSCSFQIILRPDTDSLKSSVYATTRFRLPIRYPLLPPIITVLTGNSALKGLSSNHVKGLQDLLTSKAKELAGGGEMIWDLVSAAQEYISSNNLERISGPNRSLEEEKRLREVERQKDLRKKAQEESRKRSKEEEERATKIAQLIREQSEKNTAMMQQEKDRKRDAMAFSPSDTQLMGYLGEQAETEKNLAQKTEFFMDPINVDGQLTHQVIVGPLMRSTPLSSIHLVESSQNRSQTWLMESYGINSAYYDSSIGKRILEEVEWELEVLRKVHCDKLVNILASALISPSVNDGLTSKRLLVIHENTSGPSAEVLLSHCVQLPWSRVRFYALDLIEALDVLHNRNVLHRDVSLENIILEQSPGKIAKAKLARPGYARRLHDMNIANPLTDHSTTASSFFKARAGWDAPEITLQEKENHAAGAGKLTYTRKRDIWQLGVTLLQMLLGPQIVDANRSPDEFFQAAQADKTLLGGLEPHVVMLLRGMLENSVRKRPTTTELRNRFEDLIRYEEEEQGSATLDVPYQRNISGDEPGPLALARKGLARTKSEQEDVFRPGSFWQLGRDRTAVGNTSRYENDFEELQLLGKGAYGSVFRARNKLDGRDYAIKKIRLSASAENDEKTLREITALSRLSHQNIVRYVTCWIQTQDDPAGTSTTDGTASTSTNQFSSKDFILPGLNDDFLSVGHDAFSQNASHVRFGNSDSENDDDEDEESSSYGNGKMKSSMHSSVGKLKQNGHSTDSSDDDSSSDDGSTSDEEMTHSKIHQSFSLPAQPNISAKPRWLFIQMEFVGFQTLREVIDKGLSIEESWRLFRQMIEALAHVASLGIIHRDLKPSNILIFGEEGINKMDNKITPASLRAGDGSSAVGPVGDIKIGDFGLATTTTSGQQMNDSITGGLPAYGTGIAATGGEESVDQTTEIGTNLYIAPEVLKAGSSRYDHKVDVYAAGIVFFEMLASQRVYKTGMERIQILRDLRSKEVRFPDGWNEAQMPAQTKILRKLLSHDPNERLSPLELLKSDLLPPKMEDEYIAECMRLLSMPDSTYNLQLMDSLFSRKETFEEHEARDFTFDTGSNEGAGLDNRFIGVASRYLRALFHRNGAVELEAPLLIPPNELYANQEQKPVDMLDKTGKVVQLPFDLVVPFARMVARVEQSRFKRYAIAPVFRPNLLAGGQPRSVIEVDFDIVAPEKTPAAEAEVLAVVDEMLDEVPGLNGSEWIIQISHGAILDLLLERVPSSRRDQAIAAIGKLTGSTSKNAAAQARVRLSTLGLPRSITDEIDNANISDDIDVVNEKLQRLIAVDLRPRLARATEEIRQVIESAQQFGVQRKFLFTPLLVTNPAFYRDNVYFVIMRGKGKRRDVLASGGRYDALLKRFASPTLNRAPAHAVGVQIALGRIAIALAKHQEAKMMGALNSGNDERTLFGPFMPRRCDVYVASAPGLLSTRMEICRELWSANISADLAYEHALEESPELLASTCKAEGILFLVLARSRGSIVKVKSIVTRSEHEVHRWELVTWIADRIQRLRNQVSGKDANESNLSALMSGAMVTGSEHRAIATTGTGGNAGAAGGAGIASSVTGNAIQQYAGEVEVILPERQHEKRRADKHGYNDTRRGRKQAHLGPLQENAARQVAKMIEEMTGSGSNVMINTTKFPILAVDVGMNSVPNTGNNMNTQNAIASGQGFAQSPTGFASSQWTSQSNLFATQSGTSGGNSGGISGANAGNAFHRLCAAAIARNDDGLWKLFLDTLSTFEEREYGKQLRRRIRELEGRAWLVSIRVEGAITLI